MDSVRAFIAIELPPPLHAALAAAQAALRGNDAAVARAVRWVDTQAIHLTLKFLGDTPAQRLDAIGSALEQAAAARSPLTLSLARAGCFPNARQPRVLWVGLGGELDGLAAMQAAIERAIAPLGFPAEARPFTPHLTLGRLRDDASPAARQQLGAAMLALRIPAASFVVASVSLMRSDLRPDGAVYTRLRAAPLHGAGREGKPAGDVRKD